MGKILNNYIAEADLYIQNGLLQGTMKFSKGLNIISGENGTFKTQLLRFLKSRGGEHVIPGQPIRNAFSGEPLRIQAISSKRKSERHSAEEILQSFKQNNRTWKSDLIKLHHDQINDSEFGNYASLGDLFYLVFENRCKNGADQIEHMIKITKEFNEVICAVFPHYNLLSEWDESFGAPRILISKRGTSAFPIESLSLGELDVLSLIVSINAAKDNFDVFLIDEPEVHLNWHLEEQLFAFLDELCQKYDKQIIVVTHSRTIFKPRFLLRAQFLYWEDGKVKWSQELSTEDKLKLAGDAVEIIALGEFTRPTFFVEDDAHSDVLRELAKLYKTEIHITECGNSFSVKSLFRYQKNQGRWSRAYFLIDGDNQGHPFPKESQFIHLSKIYCIENIFLDPDMLAVTTGKPVEEVRRVILEEILAKTSKIFKDNKFLDFITEKINVEHMTYERLRELDASIIIQEVAKKLGMNFKDLIPKYFFEAQKLDRLKEVVPQSLLSVLENIQKEESTKNLENKTSENP